MYMDVSLPRGSGHLPLFFNVNYHVGHLCPNFQDDVLLVQFFFRFIASAPVGAGTKAAYSKVPLTGNCDAATVDAIRWTQTGFRNTGHPNATVDGRVSPIKNGRASYGGGLYTLAYLNHLTKTYCADWPRLQDSPMCPGKLARRVEEVLGCVYSTGKL